MQDNDLHKAKLEDAADEDEDGLEQSFKEDNRAVPSSKRRKKLSILVEHLLKGDARQSRKDGPQI